MNQPWLCPIYHEYTNVLTKISRDETLWPHHRFVADYLRNVIEKTHYKRCVKNENKAV